MCLRAKRNFLPPLSDPRETVVFPPQRESESRRGGLLTTGRTVQASLSDRFAPHFPRDMMNFPAALNGPRDTPL